MSSIQFGNGGLLTWGNGALNYQGPKGSAEVVKGSHYEINSQRVNGSGVAGGEKSLEAPRRSMTSDGTTTTIMGRNGRVFTFDAMF